MVIPIYHRCVCVGITFDCGMKCGIVVIIHYTAPIKYTTVNTKIQTISRKCQNKLKQVNLRVDITPIPCLPTWSINNTIQINPQVTCSPCVPTKVKNDDK